MATYIGDDNDRFLRGATYPIDVLDMTGRVYRDADDVEGVKDVRVMAYSTIWQGNYYEVFETADDLLKVWEFEKPPVGSARTATAWHALKSLK